MRIVSGHLKGRRITAPKNLPVRPTTDMAKEALFNILNNQYYFDEISVLDLFAGTGNISYEFASRGSEQITAVDNHYGCIKFISNTAENLEIQLSTIKSDVFKFLEQTPQKFDIIFADPPYDLDEEQFNLISKIVANRTLLNEDGVLIIEHAKHTKLSEENGFSKTRNYGSSAFTFYKR
ncbi:MAG: RsmD family RNA methyltransferase [bacterium]